MKLSSTLSGGVAACALTCALGLSVGTSAAWAEIGDPVDTGQLQWTSVFTHYTDTLAFNAPTETVTRVDTYSTRILGRLSTGGTLLDQTFALPYSDPGVQAGVTQARAAITASGGPGVVIGSPTLTSRTVSLVSRTSTSQFSLDHQTQTATTVIQVGPGATVVSSGVYYDPELPGDVPRQPGIFPPGPPGTWVTINNAASGPCTAAIAALPGGARPVCGPDVSITAPIYAGQTGVTTRYDTTYYVNEAISTTETYLTAEEYTINGTVQPVGGGNQQCKFGAYSRNSIFMHGFSSRGRGGFGYGGFGGWYLDSPDGRMRAWGSVSETPHREFAGLRADEISPLAGVSAGVSFALTDTLTVGAAFEDSGAFDLADAGFDSSQMTMRHSGAFASLKTGPLVTTVAASHSEGDAYSAREMGGFQTTRGAFGVSTDGAMLEVAAPLQLGLVSVAPTAGVEHQRYQADAYSETGGLALSADAVDQSRTRAFAGVDVAAALETPVGPLSLSLSARATDQIADAGEAQALRFVGLDDPLFLTDDASRAGAEMTMGASLQLSDAATLAISYEGERRGSASRDAALLSLKVAW